MSWLRKYEKGQAVAEYSATLPLFVMIGIVLGGAVGPGVGNMYQEVVDAFKDCAVDSVNGPVVSEDGSVEIVAFYYDEETDTTYVEYEVDEDITDFSLGDNPVEVTGNGKLKVHADNGLGNGEDAAPRGIIRAKDGVQNDDPAVPGQPGYKGTGGRTTDTTDTADTTGGNGNGNGNGKNTADTTDTTDTTGGSGSAGDTTETTTGNGNGNGNGKNKGRNIVFRYSPPAQTGNDLIDNGLKAANTILLGFSGQFILSPTTVTTSDGTNTSTSTIAAPVPAGNTRGVDYFGFAQDCD